MTTVLRAPIADVRKWHDPEDFCAAAYRSANGRWTNMSAFTEEVANARIWAGFVMWTDRDGGSMQIFAQILFRGVRACRGARLEQKFPDIVGEPLALTIHDHTFRSFRIKFCGGHAMSNKGFGATQPIPAFDRLIA
jgi:hypothetical protein